MNAGIELAFLWQVLDYYTPNDWVQLNNGSATVCADFMLANGNCPAGKSLTLTSTNNDLDVGSGGVTMITPQGLTGSALCPGANQAEILATGKEGVTYGVCYDATSTAAAQTVMGGLDSCGYNCAVPTSGIAAKTACTLSGPGSIADCFTGVDVTNTLSQEPGLRGSATFWAVVGSSPALNYLYLGGSGNQLTAYPIKLDTGRFDERTQYKAGKPSAFNYPGTTPSLSWDGTNSAGALLWAIDSSHPGAWDGTTRTATVSGASHLYVYKALPDTAHGDLTYLWDTDLASIPGSDTVKFTVPTVAKGMVFVAGGSVDYGPGPGTADPTASFNCTAAALSDATHPACTGSLTVYGKLHN